MSLDPIVSLSVAVAEAPGSYAFFLGSGVSRDAGVPTGSDVFWLAVGELYRLENVTDETPDQAELEAWLDEGGRADLVYSGVLELIAPDAATRRDYLAKHFADAVPGATHERLAELATRGLVKVFVTTNFDRLLERALQARGIEPVVVTSADDLDRAPRREHAPCYVLKPHGDYLQETIRNTPAELAKLDTAIADELQEVFDRYGIVVLGYSGTDEAIARSLRSRRSRYGLYWVTRGEPAGPARSLIEAAGARVIVREGAADFLSDLERRLGAFQAQPSGLTPLLVNDQTIALLRGGDRVGLGELLRAERREFQDRFDGALDGRHQELPTGESELALERDLLPVLERRLASLMPLVLYDEELFGEEVRGLADFSSGAHTESGYTFWFEVRGWAVWWLGYVLGAFALANRRLEALGALLTTETRNRYERSRPVVESLPPTAGQDIGKAVTNEAKPGRRWFSPAWEAMVLRVENLELLVDRYPELVRPKEEPRRSLVHFDFVLTIAVGLRGQGRGAHWSMHSKHAEEMASRLHQDRQLRQKVAEVLKLDIDEFDTRAPEVLRKTRLMGEIPDTDAIAILATGSRP